MSRGTLALATVSSADFLLGTRVMLHSFQQHNAWFDGDFVIIHEDLTERDMSQLRADFAQVTFIRPSPALRDNIDRLVQAVPSFRAQKAQFLSLEAIALSAYDRVLFCDSDLLFQASIETLFDQPHALMCTGDGSYYRGNARHPQSFVEMQSDPNNIGLRRAFNAGFMLMDKSICTAENVAALIDRVDPDAWHDNVTGHTDQLVLNAVFDGQQHILGAEYNYVLLHHKEIHARTGIALEGAKVLHFNGAAKPWQPAMMHRLIQRDPVLAKAAALWRDAYRGLITR